MEIIFGLFIIAVGAFCQSSCYVPINRIKQWSWESYWLVQGIFAWLVFPLLGACLAVTDGHSLMELYSTYPKESLLALFFGVLWGVGGLTFGLSMRYLGVALGQSIALGTCAGMGTLLTPICMGRPSDLTMAVVSGIVVTLMGIGIIGWAGSRKAKEVKTDDNSTVKDFNFSKGLLVALLCGLMSACFSIGLAMGQHLCFDDTPALYQSLPATLMVTTGGMLTNMVYCFWQNQKNHTWADYGKASLWGNNVLFCALAGILWYSQFFGLSLGKAYLGSSVTLLTFSWCILMALNVTFSNVWGILLHEWKGCSSTTIRILLVGLLILVISTFLPELLK